MHAAGAAHLAPHLAVKKLWLASSTTSPSQYVTTGLFACGTFSAHMLPDTSPRPLSSSCTRRPAQHNSLICPLSAAAAAACRWARLQTDIRAALGAAAAAACEYAQRTWFLWCLSASNSTAAQHAGVRGTRSWAWLLSFRRLPGGVLLLSTKLSGEGYLDPDQDAPVLALRVHHPRHALPPLKLLRSKLAQNT